MPLLKKFTGFQVKKQSLSNSKTFHEVENAKINGTSTPHFSSPQSNHIQRREMAQKSLHD